MCGCSPGRTVPAVQLRAEGLSLREIAGRLKVHHDTVWRDLKRADEMAPVSELPVGKFARGGKDPTADLSQVISLAERIQPAPG
jgi:transposase